MDIVLGLLFENLVCLYAVRNDGIHCMKDQHLEDLLIFYYDLEISNLYTCLGLPGHAKLLFEICILKQNVHISYEILNHNLLCEYHASLFLYAVFKIMWSVKILHSSLFIYYVSFILDSNPLWNLKLIRSSLAIWVISIRQ